MSDLSTFFANLPLEPIAWSLLHFVWQGALVALVCALFLAALRGAGPRARYAVAVAGLAVMVVLPVVTSMRLASSSTTGQGSPGRGVAAAAVGASGAASLPAESAGGASPGVGETLRRQLEPHLGLFVGLWLVGVALLAAAHTGGLWRLRQLRRRAAPLRRWSTTIRRLAGRLGLSRDVSLLESAEVDSPLVIGWLKPAILVPPAAFVGLAPQQLEAILIHELAHVRRHDYAVNVLQVLLETLLFYHPGVWWLSRRARLEREHCCDDMVVSVTGAPLLYARALAAVEEMRPRTPVPALGADGGSLLVRIRRLAAADDKPPRLRTRPASLGLTLAASVAVLVALAGTAVTGEQLVAEPLASEHGEDSGHDHDHDHDHDDDHDHGSEWLAEGAARLAAAAEGTRWSHLDDQNLRRLAAWGFDEELFAALEGQGLEVSVEELGELARHGVDGEDLVELRQAGLGELTFEQTLELARHGVDGDDVLELRQAGLGELSIDQVVALARYGIGEDEVLELKAAGKPVDVESLLAMARSGELWDHGEGHVHHEHAGHATGHGHGHHEVDHDHDVDDEVDHAHDLDDDVDADVDVDADDEADAEYRVDVDADRGVGAGA